VFIFDSVTAQGIGQ